MKGQIFIGYRPQDTEERINGWFIDQKAALEPGCPAFLLRNVKDEQELVQVACEIATETPMPNIYAKNDRALGRILDEHNTSSLLLLSNQQQGLAKRKWYTRFKMWDDGGIPESAEDDLDFEHVNGQLLLRELPETQSGPLNPCSPGVRTDINSSWAALKSPEEAQALLMEAGEYQNFSLYSTADPEKLMLYAVAGTGKAACESAEQWPEEIGAKAAFMLLHGSLQIRCEDDQGLPGKIILEALQQECERRIRRSVPDFDAQREGGKLEIRLRNYDVLNAVAVENVRCVFFHKAQIRAVMAGVKNLYGETINLNARTVTDLTDKAEIFLRGKKITEPRSQNRSTGIKH